MQSVFFVVALRWAPRPFGGARAKKNTTQGVFFLLRPRGKAGEGEAPLGAGTGPEQKKKHQPGFSFFAAAPAKGKGRRSPVGSRHGARAKKTNTTQGVFFLLRPRGKAGEGEASLGAGWPRAGAQRVLLPLPFAGPATKKKKHLGGVFFSLAPCRRPTGLLLPVPFAGAAAKKKHTLGGVFFLLRPRADAHSLTAGLGGDASPSAGWCFFFAVAPPGRSLTHGGLGRFRQGPGGVFFLLRPRRVFLDNNKKCLGHYIGSKKTRRGHSKKKKKTLPRIP